MSVKPKKWFPRASPMESQASMRCESGWKCPDATGFSSGHPILIKKPRMGVTMRLKILIADDHPLVRQAMRLVFDGQDSECEFSEADGLDPALELLAANEIDLLLMDLGMPGMAGADSLHALREAYPNTKIAVITGQDDRATILECLSAGINGYILKASPIER